MILFGVWGLDSVHAHNLDQRDTYIAFDTATLSVMRARHDANNADADPGNDVPLIQKNDVVGVILKSTPGPGTDTGFGGYLTFYIPEGTQVVGAAYVQPDGAGGFNTASLKGPSIAPIGSGPVGATNTPTLAGLMLGPNVLGVTAESVSGSGKPNGTIAGVYGDTGIFYSMDPDTAWQSWTGAGGYDGNTGTNDNSLTNNSGETIVPVNKWDAGQLIAFGLKNPASPLIDPDGRGNAPWGLANAVAGPQSAYAWGFDWETWKSNGNNFHTAIEVGPWQRIRYAGSQAALDTPGLVSSKLGYVGVDASTFGHVLSGANPLPPTLDWTDGSSPNALRFSYGGLELGRFEYGRVELKILAAPGEPNSPFDVDGCFRVNTDAIGGDAGGENGGKDHLWRYYDPTVRSINSCALIQKVASKPIVASGEVFSYQIDAINLGLGALTNVKVTDALPAGLQFVSAVPAPDSTEPLVWNIDKMDPADPLNHPIFRTITVYVRATGSGEVFNTAALSSREAFARAEESVRIGSFPLLQPDKTVIPNTVPPGATVTYDLVLNNVGSGRSAEPITITENLPAGFTYVSMIATEINGGALPGGDLSVDASDPTKPVFEIGQGIVADGSLLLRFDVLVSPSQAAGVYGNSFAYEHGGNILSSGSLAPVTVGGAKIGDTLFRDWDGDGAMDAEDEGLPNVSVRLYAADGSSLLDTTTTDGNGNYFFAGLSDATYVIRVVSPGGYTQTFDADGIGTANESTVTLAFDEENFDQDFGYLPGGSGTVGDLVFEDLNGDGIFNGEDSGIGGISVNLYEDGNGNGVVDGGDFLLATTVTGAGGIYAFIDLAEGLDYLVDVDETDPDLAAHFSPDTLSATTPALRQVSNLSGTDNSADFGYKPNIPLNIGDTVFFDANGNGTYDIGTDSLLPNVGVTLYRDSNGDGMADGSSIATASTDAGGQYLFDGLAPDSYLVEVDTSDPQLPQGTSISTDSYIVVLTAADVLTADFPFVDVLSKVVDKSFATPGEQLLYSMFPSWPGPDPLTDAKVTDTVPNGTNFVSAGQGSSAGSFTSAPGMNGVDPGSPGSGTVDAQAVDDAWLDGDNQGTNYGSATAMLVDSGGGDLGNGRAVAKFDLSGIPAGVTVTGATLKLEEVGSESGNRTIGVYQLTTDWAEGSVAWNTPWSSDGGDFNGADVATLTVGGNGQYSWTSAGLTSLVSGWYQGTTENEGLILGDEDVGGAVKQFATSEAASGQPVLEIAYNGGAASPATTCSIGVSPMTVVSGGTVTVIMSLSSDTELTGVTPTAPTLAGINASATLLTGPLPASQTVPGTGTPVDFTWIYQVNLTAGTEQEFTFGGAAGNGSYNFISATSNSAQVTATGGTTVTWDLGSNTAAVPGSDPGVAASSDSIALTSVADNEIWSQSATSNYGGGAEMWTAGLNDIDHPIIRFDLSSIPANAIITSASMRLNKAEGDGTVGSVAVHRLLASWLENESTWNNRATGSPWTTAGGDYDLTPAAVTAMGGTGFHTWDLTNLVQDWIDGTENNGLLLKQLNEGVEGSNRFDTRENGTAANRPRLTVNYSVSAGTATTTDLAVSSMLVTDAGGGVDVTVSMTVSAGGAVTGIAPIPLSVIAGANGAGASYVSGPAGSPADIGGGGGSATFTWVYNITAGTLPDEVRFSGGATGTGGTFAAATSHGALVTPPLNMTVSVINPDPGVNVVDNTANFSDGPTLLASDSAQTALSGWIGDFVWIDLDRDGIYEPGNGEVPLGGVEVCVTNGVSTLCATTDGSGRYQVFDLDSNGGSPWTVTLNLATVPVGYLPTISTSLQRTLLTDTSFDDTADFGVAPPPSNPGSIGDTVWIDADEDGVVDAGELPLPGVTVWLYADNDNNGSIDTGAGDLLLGSATTDANGNYLFGLLPVGDYLVQVDSTSQVTSPAGTMHDLGMAMELVNGTEPHDVALTGGQDYTVADFGFNWAGSIAGIAYYDDDANLVRDLPGETKVADVTVLLYEDANGNGKYDGGETPVGFTQTDGAGDYIFENLPPGDYVVKFDESTVESRSMPGVYGRMVSTTGTNVGVALAAGEDYSGADAGFIEAAEVEGHVFHDLNGDGFLGAGEPRLPGVEVTLNGTDILGDPVLLTFDSDADGEYKFLIAPGVYTVSYDPDDGAIPVILTQLTTTSSYNVTAGAGDEIEDLDFGRDNPGTVGDTIFADADGDGSMGAGESGIGGVTVMLFASDGTTLLASRVTDADGGYLFAGLADGNYVVEVDTTTLPSGYSATPTVDPDAMADSRGTASVSLGGSDLDMDFGYGPVAANHSLSGTVFNDDSNGDGILDGGEPGLAGVRVTAGIDADGDGDVEQVFATVTAADGSYSFTGIPNGANVTLNVLTGTLPGDAFTPTGDRDSPAPNGDNEISLTNITSGATELDFGYEEVFGSIAGTVVAGDGDGLAEGGEAALASVTVTLTFAGADGVIGTSDDTQQVTSTDGSGDYSFTELAPGIYEIVETNPAGYASLADADGGNPDNIVTSLALGVALADQDFEDGLSAGITGRVVLDADVDGDIAEASGEAGIAGVTVTLWTDPDGDGDPSDGFAQATTTTAGDGSYGFANVVAGDYVVVETDPADHGSTGDRDGTGANSANEIAVALAGIDSTGNDFLDSPYKVDTFADWQTEQAGALAGQDEPDDNPDGDIYDNALEYALCLPPGSGSNLKPFCSKLFSGSGTVDAIFFRRRGGLSDVTYTLETATVLGDPTAWTDWEGASPTVDISSAGIPVVAEKVTFSDLPSTVGAVGFVRLRVEIAGDSTSPHHTQVFGWHTVTNTASCETCSFPYAPKEAFSSTPSSISGDRLTLTVVGTPLLGSGDHYIEILSGIFAGHRFDVASVAADTVVLGGASSRDTLSPVPDLSGAPFALRPHATLDSIAPPALFAANNDPSAGDRILAFDGAGWTTYWMYDLGGTQPKQWTDVADGGLSDAGGTVVDAPDAFFLHPKSGDVDLVLVGVVREWPFACPLQTGYNLVGSGYPFAQSPAGREMLRDDSVQGDTIAGKNWFDGSNDPLVADQLMFWNGDAAPGTTGYHTYFRLYLGAGLDHWTDQTDSALADSDADPLFGRSRGAFIDMMQGHDRSDASDVWVWPLPWSADSP
ncbi:MAG: putative repeat protein (TIGR01451 family) [Verrucomicrobiales bacterium]|jgi:uncharacterized repeat protein (TIGR01451 family)